MEFIFRPIVQLYVLYVCTNESNSFESLVFLSKKLHAYLHVL